MVAQHLGLVRQVVRVHADAVAAHQAGLEAQEVPLCRQPRSTSEVSMPILSKMMASSFISAMLRSRCVFSITLLARLGRLDAGAAMHAWLHDAFVHGGHLVQRFRRIARHHLDHVREHVLRSPGLMRSGE